MSRPRVKGGVGSRVRILAAMAVVSVSMGSPGTAGATVFAQDGWGWWWETGDAGAMGRGGTSAAVTGYGATGSVNPATIALAGLNYGFISYAGEITSVRGPEPDGSKNFRQRSDLWPHMGGVAVLPGGIRVSGLFRAQSDATYERMQRFSDDASGPYNLKTEGSGGLGRFQIGVAAPALGRRLLLGASAGRIQGVLKESFTQNFDASEDLDLRQFVDTRLRGAWTGSCGLVAIPTPALSVGVSGSVGGSSRMIQEVTIVQGASFHEVQKGRQKLPGGWAAGVRFAPMARVALSADLIRTLWSDAKMTPGSGASSHPFHDTTKWGVGDRVRRRDDPRSRARFYAGVSEDRNTTSGLPTRGMPSKSGPPRLGPEGGQPVGGPSSTWPSNTAPAATAKRSGPRSGSRASVWESPSRARSASTDPRSVAGYASR